MIKRIFYFLLVLVCHFQFSCSSNFDLSKIDNNDTFEININLTSNTNNDEGESEFWPFGVKRVGVSSELKREPLPLLDVALVPQPSSKRPRILAAERKSVEKFKIVLPNYKDPQIFENPVLAIPFRNEEFSELFLFGINTTHEEIIEQEILSSKFKQPRLDIYRQALNLISANNLEEFKAFYPIFFDSFKISNMRDFSKGDFSNRLQLFVVLFGASNLTQFFSYYLYSESQIFFDAFRYLIGTKPFKVALETILKSFPSQLPDYKFALIKCFELNYPEMGYFARKAVNFIGFNDLDGNPWEPLLLEGTEEQIFKAIYDYFIENPLKSHSIFADIIDERPDLFISSSLEVKFIFAALAVKLDRDDLLRKLYDLDNNIIRARGFLKTLNERVFDLFDYCVIPKSRRCFRMLLGIDSSKLSSGEGKTCSTLEFILERDDNFFEIIFDFGFNHLSGIIQKGTGISYNLIQIAFLKKNLTALQLLVERFGGEVVARSILTRWPTAISQLLNCCDSIHCLALLRFCVTYLGLNMVGPYEHEGKRGNICVFLPQSSAYYSTSITRAFNLPKIIKKKKKN